MITFLAFLTTIFLGYSQVDGGTFSVDYENHVFLKDGQPFRYIAGDIHYFRVHPDYWQDRLQKIRAAGMNAITTYVPWNLHEAENGTYDFTGWLNLTHFITLAQQNDLYVLLRPGPYIDAEFEFGGFPYWLLNIPNIYLRHWNVPYINAVEQWFNVLLDVVKPLLYKNGGPILMIQVENEYGIHTDRYGHCDKNYTSWLRDLYWSKLGNDVQLYTTDNADNNASIECGKLNGTLTTVDFGTTSVSNILYVLFRQQDYHSGGAPHVCSEFWVIWYSYWGDTNPHIWGDNQPGQKHDLALYKSNIEAMFYQANASWSQYMIHGGTNFAWNAGATGQLAGITTSYDYAAAISEDGDTTDTYFALRDLISNISGWENKPLAVPPNNTKTNYGPVTLTRIGTNLVSTLTRIQETCVSSKDPLSFEQINHGYGFVLYTTTLKAGGNTLSTPNLRDHGFVYLNNVYLGWLLRDNTTTININAKPGDTLRILVENRGRNPAETPDSKGLNVQARLAWGLRGNGNVTLDGALLQDWFQCGINLTKASVDSLTTTFLEEELVEESVPEKAASQPGFYVGTFTANTLADTFFDSRGWGKGQLFLNGYNLGRYWPLVGPQMTLYVPKPFLQQTNTVVLLELLGGQQNTASFIDHKVWVYPPQ